jgi:outer membrane immunogenic protein
LIFYLRGFCDFREKIMRTSKILSIVSGVVLLTVGVTGITQAPAADMPETVSHYSWNGPYVGVFLGAGAAVTDLSFGPASFDGVGGEGIIAGGIVGYNFQMSPQFVLGIEGELGINDLETKASLGPFSLDAGPDFTGAISARIGWLLNPSAMLYLIGGYTWQDWDVKISTPGPSFTFSQNYNGFHIGTGIEAKVSSALSVRAEYRFVQLGSESWSVPGLSVKPSEHTGRIAVVWNFVNLM